MQNPIPLFAPVTRAILVAVFTVCVAKAEAAGGIMVETVGSLLDKRGVSSSLDSDLECHL